MLKVKNNKTLTSNKNEISSSFVEGGFIDVEVLNIPDLKVRNQPLFGLVDSLRNHSNLILNPLKFVIRSTVGLL